ncbi:MAG: 23S rRNA (guanosine(2251)-2'-O)-methyltransferase RlmB [bacterium]
MKIKKSKQLKNIKKNTKRSVQKSNKLNNESSYNKNSYSKNGSSKNNNNNSKRFIREEFEDDGFQLEGRNSVLEALNFDKPIDKIFVKKGEVEGTLKVIVAKAIEKGIIVQEVDKLKMEQMRRTNNPQGVIALCPAHEYCDVEDILEKAKKLGQDPFIIILDEISDPHNLGAIIRTADATGAHGVIIPKRRAVGLTAIVSKTASGALEHVPVARVSNISNEIEKLKKAGIWIACAHMKGTEYFNADLKGPLAIVIGNEGEGVSRLVREKSDYTIKIPMYGNIESLNASVASAVLMYEVVRQRNFLN